MDRVIEGGLLLLLGVSTLVFGGVAGWGLAATVLISSGLLLCWTWRAVSEGEIRWHKTPLDLPLLAFLLLFLIQMVVGFPWGWSGSGALERMTAMAMEKPGWLPFLSGTLDYHGTREAFVLFCVYAGVFYLVVSSLRSRLQMNRFLTGVSAFAAFVAFYGLLEFLSGNQSIFGYKAYASGRLRGTFVNPDHFAAYLAMAIPMMTALLVGIGARRRRRRHHRGGEASGGDAPQTVSGSSDADEERTSLFDRERRMRPTDNESRRMLLGISSTVSITALAFTMSRGGIIGFLVGALVFVSLLWIREPGHRKRLAGVGIALATVTLIIWIGAEPILQRFGLLEVDSTSRAMLYRDVMQMIRTFPILGAGLGTFVRVFPRFAAPEFTFEKFASHAHNEWLELTADGGLIALCLLLVALAWFLRDILLRPIFGLGVESRGTLNVERDPESAQSAQSDTDSDPQFAQSRNPAFAQSQPSNPQFAIRNSQSESAPQPSNPQSRNRAIAQSAIPNSQFPTIRHDPYNIAIVFGCVSALVAIAVHSLFDFPLRFPANGILLATILGVGVVAARTRLHGEYAESIVPVRRFALSRRGRLGLLVGSGCLALFLGWTAVAGVLAEGFRERGEELIAPSSGPGARADRPWVIETAKNKEALSLLGRAVALDPMSPEAQYALGQLEEQLAARAWNAGLSEEGRFVSDLGARSRSARLLLDRSMQRYAAAVTLAPSYADAWDRLGWAYTTRPWMAPRDPEAASKPSGDVEKGLAVMRQAIAMNPNNRYRYEVLAAYGFSRLEIERPVAGLADPIVREAILAQQEAVDLDPRYLPEALSRMLRYTNAPEGLMLTIPAHAPDALYAARLLEEQERWPQAKVFFRRAIELAEDDAKPIYYREYAEALTRRGEDAEAREILEIVLQFDPHNLDLRLALARALQRLNQTAEASKMYENALELANAAAREVRSSTPLPLVSLRAPIHQTREEKVFAEIRVRFPGPQKTGDALTQALMALGTFYHEQGRDDVAVPLWEKAIERSPDDAQAAFGLAQTYDGVGAWVSAVDYYKKAIELNKGNLQYRLTLADRYSENDMNFQAINLWQEILVVRPTLLPARLKLAAAYIRLEQFPEAVREYERVLQLEPKNQDARDALTRLRSHPFR
jgi:tetratricopeptide (TPR) repeat protein/O-antigen ligase